MPVEESWATMETTCYGWVMWGGAAITTASLSPHPASADEQERLARQTPDVLNYRVGPHPGWPLYVPDMLSNREGCKAREPSKCLGRQRYTERLAKEAFWSPATRGSKKDTDMAITSTAEAAHVPAYLAPPVSPQAKKLCHTQLCEYLVLPEPLRPKQLNHLHLALTGANPSPKGQSQELNLSKQPTCRGRNKTTVETQGQCG